jgi:general secretion pathway protein A
VYRSHFDLAESPFSITPDPRYLYLSPQHREGLAHLLFGIRQPGGFVQLTGEVGTGKTILCRCLLDQLPPEVDVSLILHPPGTAVELLAAVCDELRVAYPAGTQSIKDLVDALYRHLLDAHARGRRTVIILDEAQNLSPAVLEQVRLLTNLETSTEKLVQIILIGQPELLRTLARRELRQLTQRVTARCHLRPFAMRETCRYIAHRLEVGGGHHALFTPAAMRAVHRRSGGVPRVINVLCDRALLGAYARGERQVGTRIVRRAARELRGARGRWQGVLRPAWPGVLLAVLAALAVSLYLDLGGVRSALPPAIRSPVPAALPAPPAAATASDTPAPAVGGSHAGPPIHDAPVADPPVRLPELLAATGASDDDAAFEAVYARWGAAYRPGTGCQSSAPGGLECVARRGNWTRLRRFNGPVVLELRTPAGESHRVALVALDPRDATLVLGGREHRFPVTEIDAAWDGGFFLLWRAPAVRSRVIGPGARGADVRWVADTLDALEGATGANATEAYDEALGRRVLAFQRSRHLAEDGIVGEETLLELAVARREAGAPSLWRDER